MGIAGYDGIDLHGNFQLQNDHVILCDFFLQESDFLRGDRHIRAGYHDDPIVGLTVFFFDLDVAHGRRLRFGTDDPFHIHAGGTHALQHRVAKSVPSNFADHRHFRAGTGGLNRLVRSFSAGGRGIMASQNGFALCRKPWGRNNQIHYKTAYDQNFSLFHFIPPPHLSGAFFPC